MKQLLLLFFLSISSSLQLLAQEDRYLYPQQGCGQTIQPQPASRNSDFAGAPAPLMAVKIFPNPATHYIQLAHVPDGATWLAMYNLVGREVKRFSIASERRYFVGDLSAGMYLVQVLDRQLQPLATMRLSKK